MHHTQHPYSCRQQRKEDVQHQLLLHLYSGNMELITHMHIHKIVLPVLILKTHSVVKTMEEVTNRYCANVLILHMQISTHGHCK